MHEVSALLVGLRTTVESILAQNPPPPDQGPEFGKASPIGLVVIILLGLATVLLIRSMTRRLNRLPTTFDHGDADDRQNERSSASEPRGEANEPSADRSGGKGSDAET